jgi:5'-3' exonuclease
MSKILPTIAAYPPSTIDKYLKNSNCNKLHIYVDLKNIQTGLWVDDIVREIVGKSESYNIVDCTIFQDLLKFCCWWRKFGKEKNLETKIFVTTDFGSSSYHKKIHKDYKSKRKIAKINMPDFYQQLPELTQKNDQISEKVYSKLPNLHFFRLHFLESDFLHYWLITRKFKNKDDIFHVICSNDKDMYQSLTLKNVIQVYSLRGNKHIIDKNNCLQMYAKTHKKSVNSRIKADEMISKIDKNYIAAIMALIGDAGDEVPGIKKMGPMSAIKLFSDEDFVSKYIGSIGELNDRVSNNESYFKLDTPTSKYGKIAQSAIDQSNIVTDAYKMISFEMLCRWLEKRNTTEKIEWTNYLESTLKKENCITNGKLLYNALSKKIPELMLTESYLNYIFEN